MKRKKGHATYTLDVYISYLMISWSGSLNFYFTFSFVSPPNPDWSSLITPATTYCCWQQTILTPQHHSANVEIEFGQQIEKQKNNNNNSNRSNIALTQS